MYFVRLMSFSLKEKNSKKIGDGTYLGLREVKNTYKDVDDYLATFEPLLFEEVKAQIVQGKDDEESIFLFLTLFSSQNWVLFVFEF